MRINFSVKGLPPKKDGANSMWRKSNELSHLKSLRTAASEAMKDMPPIRVSVAMSICIYADPSAGDLDNFITGVCDGLMAVHPLTPIDLTLWQDVAEQVNPRRAICFTDDAVIDKIIAERRTPRRGVNYYTVELEWLA